MRNKAASTVNRWSRKANLPPNFIVVHRIGLNAPSRLDRDIGAINDAVVVRIASSRQWRLWPTEAKALCPAGVKVRAVVGLVAEIGAEVFARSLGVTQAISAGQGSALIDSDSAIVFEAPASGGA